MTRSELRTLVRNLLAESATGFYTDAKLNECLYESLIEAAKYTDYVRFVSTYTTTVGTAEYPLPAYFVFAKQVTWGANEDELDYVTQEELSQSLSSWRNSGNGIPAYWYLGDNTGTFGVYPKPATADTITLYWHGIPDDFADDDAHPPLPVSLHRALAYKAAALAMQGDDNPDYKKAKQLEGLFYFVVMRNDIGYTYVPTVPPSAPVANFTATPVSGTAPLTVQFTDTSTNTPTSWSWDFGDELGTSTEQNPSYTYASGESYTITLTATNAGGSDTKIKTDYITVTEAAEAPTAAFSGTPRTGTAPLTVQFTDASTGGPTSWLWNFGDGNTSTEQSPSHQYASAGTYTVTLTVTNDEGSDGETKTGYVIVSAAPLTEDTIKRTSWIPASTATVADMCAKYDLIDSVETPTSLWIAENPDIKLTLYKDWTQLNLVPEASGTPTDESSYDCSQQWYRYAVANSLDWETGFYHLSTIDTYNERSISGYGEYMDAKIRYVLLKTAGTNYADAAWNGTASLTLSAPPDAVYFGRLDRFDRIALEFSTAASANWAGAWEYWNGSSWAALSVTDGTSDCTVNGTVSFTPPTSAQWARCKVNLKPTYWGDDGVYWVRLRCTSAGTTAPTIDQAQGRHYWVHNGTAGNTIPAWDDANDPDGDGYAEYPAGNAAATAKFKYEARIPHGWSWVQYVSYPAASAGFRTALINGAIGGADALTSIWGIRLDNVPGDCYIPTALQTKILEYPGKTAAQTVAQWKTDFAVLLAQAQTACNAAGYLFGGNTGWTGISQFSQYLDFHMREDISGSGGLWRTSYDWETSLWSASAEWQLRGDAGSPMVWQWQLTFDYRNSGYAAVTLTNGSAVVTTSGEDWSTTVEAGDILHVSVSGVDYYLEIASVDGDNQVTLASAWAKPNTSTTGYIMNQRDKYAGLACFLVIQNQATDYFSTWWGYSYNAAKAPYFNWLDCYTIDLGNTTNEVPDGKPARGTRGAYVLQSGSDPSYPSNTYYVYARAYDTGLAIYRPKTASGSYGASSAVTVNLPSAMYKVDYDGTLGSLVTSVTLRGGEGAIFKT